MIDAGGGTYVSVILARKIGFQCVTKRVGAAGLAGRRERFVYAPAGHKTGNGPRGFRERTITEKRIRRNVAYFNIGAGRNRAISISIYVFTRRAINERETPTNKSPPKSPGNNLGTLRRTGETFSPPPPTRVILWPFDCFSLRGGLRVETAVSTTTIIPGDYTRKFVERLTKNAIIRPATKLRKGGRTDPCIFGQKPSEHGRRLSPV